MIKIYGHRGARGLSPENTLPAYLTALTLGVDAIDMDVGMTKDGEVVVIHGAALDPHVTRDAKGRWLETDDILVKDLTLKELQSYDVGRIKPDTVYSQLFPCQYPVDKTPVPTLRQVIALAKKIALTPVSFQIEIKTYPEHPERTATPEMFAQAITKILEEENIVAHTEVQAFDWRCLIALQKINPAIATAYLTHSDSVNQMSVAEPATAGLWTAGYLLKDYDYSIPKMIAALGGKIWGPQDTELTTTLVKEAHNLGLKVVPWSWPEKSAQEVDVPMLRELINMQVDGIITDRPDILRGLLAANGKLAIKKAATV